MIPTNPAVRQIPGWQRALARALAGPDALLAHLGLPADLPRAGAGAAGDFPLRVPLGFADRMQRGNPRDPLFLQVWDRPEEAAAVAGFGDDAVGDLAALKPGGVVHKYRGRALVVATGACAVHCRYCFRRHFPYSDHLASRDRWRDTLATLAADRSIHEVILSGGDPLSLNDEKLSQFSEALEFLPQVRTLRIHTRVPVVLPERVDDGLLAWLRRGRLRKVVVVHANHANEIDDAVARGFAEMRNAGVTLLNQSVLLRDVNDSAAALAGLSERLFDAGVLPYYLHMLDPVRGAAHFEVTEPEARALLREVAARLPGYLVPRLVRERPGAASKLPLAW